MIKGIIFDLDGTLLNTSRDIQKVLNDTLAYFSLPPLGVEEVKKIVGGGAKNLILNALKNTPELAGEALKIFREKYAKSDNLLTDYYDGEQNALERFSSIGIKMAVLTNKPQDATIAVFDKYLAKFNFCEVLGQTEYFPVKPDPSSTKYLLGKMGLRRDECLFVGDGETDVMTAKNANIRCVAALWGYRKKSDLLKAGAEIFAENFVGLEKIVIDEHY